MFSCNSVKFLKMVILKSLLTHRSPFLSDSYWRSIAFFFAVMFFFFFMFLVVFHGDYTFELIATFPSLSVLDVTVKYLHQSAWFEILCSPVEIVCFCSYLLSVQNFVLFFNSSATYNLLLPLLYD